MVFQRLVIRTTCCQCTTVTKTYKATMLRYGSWHVSDRLEGYFILGGNKPSKEWGSSHLSVHLLLFRFAIVLKRWILGSRTVASLDKGVRISAALFGLERTHPLLPTFTAHTPRESTNSRERTTHTVVSCMMARKLPANSSAQLYEKRTCRCDLLSQSLQPTYPCT